MSLPEKTLAHGLKHFWIWPGDALFGALAKPTGPGRLLMSVSQFTVLQPVFDKRFVTDDNVFRSVFGKMPHHEWVNTIRSISDRIIQDIEFPSFPDEALQSQFTGIPVPIP